MIMDFIFFCLGAVAAVMLPKFASWVKSVLISAKIEKKS